MKSLGTGIALAASIILTGCAAFEYKPPEYDESHSRAYNIARAGGLVTGIADATAPRDKTGNLTSNAAFGTAYTAAGFGTGVTGINGMAGGAINFLNWVSTPDSHGGRNSLMAWMPVSEASSPEEAHKKMLAYVDTAIKTVLKDVGVKYELVYTTDEKRSYLIVSEKWGCPPWINGQTKTREACWVRAQIYEPNVLPTPSYLNVHSGPSYDFGPTHGHYYHALRVSNGTKSSMPEDIIYQKLSVALPSWAYLYLAPKKVRLASGEKVPYPVLLENGHPEFFVYPES